jgi:hypothetical protein
MNSSRKIQLICEWIFQHIVELELPIHETGFARRLIPISVKVMVTRDEWCQMIDSSKLMPEQRAFSVYPAKIPKHLLN